MCIYLLIRTVFMKITKIIGGATLCLAMAIGVGVGIGAKAEVKSAKADATDYIYLDNSNWYQGNERYAAYFFNDEDSNEWVDFTWDSDINYNKVAIPVTSYTNVILCRMNGSAASNEWANRWDSTADLTNHTGIYKPYGRNGEGSSGSWEYPLTIGENTTFMIPHGSDKVYASMSVLAGSAVTLKADEDSSAYGVTAETLASNNLTSSSAIKVAGTVDIYVAKDGWTTWVSGYAPASTKLQDFCDAILNLNCDATDLTSCGWSGLSVSDKLAFNNATVKLGNDKTYADYGNVVNEAATRYALLVAKGATPLDGVTISASSEIALVPANNSQNNISTFIIVLASAAVLVTIGAFYFAKRRKEEK